MIKAIDASFAGNGCKYPTQSWIFFFNCALPTIFRIGFDAQHCFFHHYHTE